MRINISDKMAKLKKSVIFYKLPIYSWILKEEIVKEFNTNVFEIRTSVPFELGFSASDGLTGVYQLSVSYWSVLFSRVFCLDFKFFCC